MASCLICSDLLLRQVRSGKPVLYCRTCRVEYENQKGFSLPSNLEISEPTLKLPILDPAHAWQTTIVEPTPIAS